MPRCEQLSALCPGAERVRTARVCLAPAPAAAAAAPQPAPGCKTLPAGVAGTEVGKEEPGGLCPDGKAAAEVFWEVLKGNAHFCAELVPYR